MEKGTAGPVCRMAVFFAANEIVKTGRITYFYLQDYFLQDLDDFEIV